MDKKELRAHILSRWQKLETERDPFIPQWKSIATHIRPATGKFLLRGPKNEARERFNEIFDNTATGASNLLSSGLMSGLTDPSQQWFYLTTGSPTLDESPAVKQGLAGPGAIGVQEMLLGNIPGSLGEVAAAALLCGFVYLLWRRVITWHIPVTVLATMAVFAGVVAMCSVSFDALPQAADGTCSAGYKLGYLFGTAWRAGIFHVLAGGAMLGAIFMATDYSTSPMTVRGGVIFAVGIGLITMCIRLWGAYPEGMSFAILIMNACVPLINKYVKPKRFGVK